MLGIDLNESIIYKGASLRYFSTGEYHINRIGQDDVLLLVFSGILRFTEDGTPFEINAGQYHIQRLGSRQVGDTISDEPKYLYIHFLGQWSRHGHVLPCDGTFDVNALHPLMSEMDRLSHSHATLTEQSAIFFQILSALYHKEAVATVADEIAEYIQQRYTEKLTLQQIADHFHFSKNHVINLFRSGFQQTPYEYVLQLRLNQAKWLLEVTSDPVESIARDCGFSDYSHFYKMFRQQSALSPTQWRQKMRG